MRIEVKTTYISELGNGYSTPERAIADDDRLPRLISTYEGDLVQIETLGTFGGKKLMPLELAEMISDWKRIIADYKNKWARVQAQRAAGENL